MTQPEVVSGLQPLRGVYKNELAAAITTSRTTMTTTATPTTAPLSVSEVVHVDCRMDSTTMKNIVLWEDILLAFEDAIHVRHNSRVLPFLRGPNFQVLEPFRIEAMPDVVLSVVLRDPLNQQDARGASSLSSTSSTTVMLGDIHPAVVAAAPTASTTSTRTTPASSAAPLAAPTTPVVTANQLQSSLRTAISLLDDNQGDEDDDTPPPNYQQAMDDPIYYTTMGNGTAAAPLRTSGHRLFSSMASVLFQPLPMYSNLAPSTPRTTTNRTNATNTTTTNSNSNNIFPAARAAAAPPSGNGYARRNQPEPLRTTNTTTATFHPLLSNSTRAGLGTFTDYDSRRGDDNRLSFFATAAVVDPNQRPSVVMHQLQNRVGTNNNDIRGNNTNIISASSNHNTSSAGLTGGQRATTATATAAGAATEAVTTVFRPLTGVRNTTANTTNATTPTTANNSHNNNLISPFASEAYPPITPTPWISRASTATTRANVATAASGTRQPVRVQQQPEFNIVNGLLTRVAPSSGKTTTTTTTTTSTANHSSDNSRNIHNLMYNGNSYNPSTTPASTTTTTVTFATNTARRPQTSSATPWGSSAPLSPSLPTSVMSLRDMPPLLSLFTPPTTTTATAGHSVDRFPEHNNPTSLARMTGMTAFAVLPVPAPPLPNINTATTTTSSATNTNHPKTTTTPTAAAAAAATSHKLDIEMLIASAKQGKAESQLQLASIYRDGTHGVMQDYYMATKWFLIVGKSRTHSVRVEAQTAIARMYETGGADANAVDENDGGGGGGGGGGDSRWTMGNCGNGGRGGKPDFKKAFEWYLRAAMCPLLATRTGDERKGHPGAQFKVGEFLWKGIIFIDGDTTTMTEMTMIRAMASVSATSPKKTRNIPHALEWFQRAANQDHAQAKCSIGMIYLQGEDEVPGVKKDLRKAVEWFLNAAEQGHMEAQWQLGMLYIGGGVGVSIERFKGLEWCRKAAVQGHEEARRVLLDQGISLLYSNP